MMHKVKKMSNIRQVYNRMKDILSRNPNCEPGFESDELIKHLLGKSRLETDPRQEIDEELCRQLYDMCRRRAEGYPLQYMLGNWDFFDLNLKVGEGVLIPRRDTEDVCLAAFEYINGMVSPNVLDLCAGSGAIALAVKRYCPDATVVALEKYEQAYEYLVENIERNSLCVLPILGDVFRYDYKIEEESFDVIISNPPYVNPSLKGKMQKEVQFEPFTRLFAEDEGLRFYKFIAQYYKPALKEGGYLIFEHGYDQARQVKQLLIGQEYKIVREIVDTAGNARGIVAQKI